MSTGSGALPASSESRETFACFGSQCTVIVSDHREGQASAAVIRARQRLLEWHSQFSRFEPASELSRLNADPRETVPVSPLLRRIVEVGVLAAQRTGGLVDPTLATEIERAGYTRHLAADGVPLELGLALAPPRARAAADPAARWRQVIVNRAASTITRPSAVKIDVGGIAKGVFADELAAGLSGYGAFAIDCAGDIRLGGSDGTSRELYVESPFDDSILNTFTLASRGAATSGIGKRSWLTGDRRPAHHLLDPATGEPAFTGVVQVTALAPSAAEAEVLAKAALLSGPQGAPEWLVHGGVVVHDDRSCAVIAAGARHRELEPSS
ncbi:MAG: FAD:protein FMN transferase [Solirubrobacterales bacterium]|nr:FAD:protein FMN transferase [Solirubrobacterales bacterium]